MLNQIKKFSVVITIAILFTVLVFSISELIVERPDYSDFCGMRNYRPREIPIPNDCPDDAVPDDNFLRECHENGGIVTYDYSSQGCAVSYECDTCSYDYSQALSTHRRSMFIVSSLLGLLAVIAGLHLKSKNEVMEWVYSGFILGGLASIFIGTISYYNDMDRFVRPIVMIAEIALVVWVGVKTSKSNLQTNSASTSKFENKKNSAKKSNGKKNK